MSANAETQTPQQPVKKSGKRKRLLLLLTLLFIIIAVAIGIYWFLVLRHFEETDDAYVAGNQIQIMSQVSGSVTKVWAVRWYCKYGISYRELQEMLAERGVNVDHSTIYRWVQRYAPEMEKRLRWYWRNPSDLCPWHMDETYVKVNGRWAYLYRAVDSRGRTVDFYLSSRRNSKAAYRFLGKILNNVKKWQIPRFINTDKAPAYGRALALLKREGRCPSDVEHRQIKYRNNVIECDHGKLKRIINATLGFKSMKTAYATIKGIEVMRALRKGQASAFYYGDPLGEMRLVSRVFEM